MDSTRLQGTFQPLFVTSQAQLCAQSVIMTANSTINYGGE